MGVWAELNGGQSAAHTARPRSLRPGRGKRDEHEVPQAEVGRQMPFGGSSTLRQNRSP